MAPEMTTKVSRSRKQSSESSKSLRCTNKASKMTNKQKRCKRTEQKRCKGTSGSKELQPAPARALSIPLMQRLYVTCKDVFKSGGPADLHPSDVHKIKLILDPMVPGDLGLSSKAKFFNPDVDSEGVPIKGDGRIGYTSIYNSKNLTICMFFLGAGSAIPLHNHPGMTVFSKLLVGTLHVKAYDWVDQVESEDSSTPPSEWRLAKLKANKIISAPCETSVLYPTTGGNLHEFRAITPCAIIDVIGPPYSTEEGRDCTYYKDIPYSAMPMAVGEGSSTKKEEAESSFGLLAETEGPRPDSFYTVEYMGPPII